ncbi:MAG TPA: RagB/SusD family nutrient uptake outer membrane protein, partial [Cyclobacteriaceae bacterium]
YNTVWTDQDFARTAVRFERRLELSDEGHRFFDLVRWGIAATVLNDYLGYERAKVAASPFVGASFTAGKNEYMPIPQREIDILTSDVLKQNPGY